MQPDRTTVLSINLNKSSTDIFPKKPVCCVRSNFARQQLTRHCPLWSSGWLETFFFAKPVKLKADPYLKCGWYNWNGRDRHSKLQLQEAGRSSGSCPPRLGKLLPCSRNPGASHARSSQTPQSNNPRNGSPRCPSHALSSVVVSSQKNFIATDDRSIQKHCSCSRHAANQQPEQMKCKSPSEGGPGGCHQPAPTT